MNYDWPGNVRELENAIERAVVLGSTELILPENLPQSVLQGVPADFDGSNPLCDGVRDAKRQLVVKALEQTGGNQTEAAKLLSVHPNHLSRLIRNMRLKTRRHKSLAVG
jgi:Nif-specific regulatory protein